MSDTTETLEQLRLRLPTGLPVRAGGQSGFIGGHFDTTNMDEAGCWVDFPDPERESEFFLYRDLEILPRPADDEVTELPATLSTMIFTVFTHAGGATKTSIVLNVGHRLGELGYRVLLIDLDPQANLTDWLGVEETTIEQTVYGLAVDNAPLPEPLRVHGIELIPSHIEVAVVEGRLSGSIAGVMRLRKALEAERGRWDVVLIDSPPSLGKLAGFAALAADKLIVPMPMRKKGVNALAGINRMMPEYREMRSDLTIGCYVPTMYSLSRNKDKELYQELIEMGFGPMTSPVPQRDARWNDAAAEGKPLTLIAPKSDAAEDIRRLTNELIAILGIPTPGGSA